MEAAKDVRASGHTHTARSDGGSGADGGGSGGGGGGGGGLRAVLTNALKAAVSVACVLAYGRLEGKRHSAVVAAVARSQ